MAADARKKLSAWPDPEIQTTKNQYKMNKTSILADCMKAVVISALIISFPSCKKDKPSENPNPAPEDSKGVYIINEGGFQKSNGSVSFYNHAKRTVSEDLFKAKNGRPLGDVVQSLTYCNNKAYVVVNNSGKIEVVDLPAFKSLGTITGLASPRFFLGVSPSKAYVTDMFSKGIHVIDLSSNTVVKKIPCPGSAEELILLGEKAFVTNLSGEYLYIVNTVSDMVEDSIKIGYGSGSLCTDKSGRVWVLCSGDYVSKAGGLYRINPSSGSVEQAWGFPATESPWKLRINSTKDTLYYLNNSVYQLPVSADTLPSSPLIPSAGRYLYGLGIEPGSGVIYVSDAVDFTQKGSVFRYKSNGALINTFKAEIAPSGFLFYKF
jgi:DNA-binding beta-propeller fold protein YncE